MMRSLVAAAVVIAFVAVLWFILRVPTDDVAQSDGASSASEVKREAGSAPAPRRRPAAVDVDETANDPTPWEILVLGARDAPLAGVTVKPVIDERTDRPRTTDAAGLARLQRFPGQTFVVVDLGGTAPAQRVRLSEPRTVVRIPDALPLVVHLVDGETGAAIVGGSVKVDGRDVPPAPNGDGFRVGATSALRGAKIQLDVVVKAPKAYVGFEGPINALVGTFTEAAELTIVLWPELDLTVDVRDSYGAPAEEAAIASVRVAGQERLFYGPNADAAGHAAVHGVPFVRNAPVSIRVGRTGRSGIGDALLGSIPSTRCAVPITLMESPPGGVAATTSADTLTSRMWSRRIEAPPDGDATVVVSMTRVDGRAAADVPIGLIGVGGRRDARTDADGRVTFSRVRAGTLFLAVYGEGITDTDREVVAVAGATTTVSIRAALGLTSTITVLDETSRPLPCAAVSIVGDGGHVQDEGGVQQLILRADAYGRCRLHGLPVGKSTAHVQWDSRSADLEFTAGEDATVVLAAER